MFLVEIEHFLGQIQVFRPELLNPFLERNHNFDEEILVFNIFQLPIFGSPFNRPIPTNLPTAPAEQIPHLLAARQTPGFYGIIEKHWSMVWVLFPWYGYCFHGNNKHWNILDCMGISMLRCQWIWGNSTGMVDELWWNENSRLWQTVGSFLNKNKFRNVAPKKKDVLNEQRWNKTSLKLNFVGNHFFVAHLRHSGATVTVCQWGIYQFHQVIIEKKTWVCLKMGSKPPMK